MTDEIELITSPIRRYKRQVRKSRQTIIEAKQCRSCGKNLPRTKSPFGFIYALICPKCGSNQ